MGIRIVDWMGIRSKMILVTLAMGIFLLVASVTLVNSIHSAALGASAIIAALFVNYYDGRLENFEKKIFNSQTLIKIRILIWLLITTVIVSFQFGIPNHILSLILTAICTLIGLKIIYSSQSPRLPYSTLCEILLVAFLVRFTIFYSSSFPVGVDSWGHLNMIRDFVYFGNIEVGNSYVGRSNQYLQMPLFLLGAALTKIIADIPFIDAYFILGLSNLATFLFIYSIANFIFKDVRVSLISTLVFSFSTVQIFLGAWIIPQTLGVLFYFSLLLIFFKILFRYDQRYSVLLILLLIAIILTHTISTFALVYTLLILSFIFILSKGERKRGVTLFHYTLLAIISTLFVWDSSTNFLLRVVQPFLKTIQESPGLGEELPRGITYVSASAFIDYSGYILLLIGAIVGSLYVIRTKPNFIKVTIVFITFGLLLFIYLFSTYGIQNIMPSRWFYYAYGGLAILFGYGFLSYFGRVNRKMLYSLIPGFLVFLMLSNVAFASMSPIKALDGANFDYYVFEDSGILPMNNIESYGGRVYCERQFYFGVNNFVTNNSFNRVDFDEQTVPKGNSLVIIRHKTVSLDDYERFDTKYSKVVASDGVSIYRT